MAGINNRECWSCNRANDPRLKREYEKYGDSPCDNCPVAVEDSQTAYFDKPDHLQRSKGNDPRPNGHRIH